MLAKILTRIAPGLTLVSDWCGEFERLLALRNLHPKTINKRKGNLAHLKRAIGQLRLGSIRPIHIAEAVHQIWQSGRQNTARRVLLEARELFAEAVAAGLIGSNPAASIKPLPVQIRRQRMRLEEWQALYDASLKSEPAWVSKMLLLALVTGQRRADLQKMAFADVRDGYLFIEQQKTGERVALPLKLKLKPVGVSLGQVIRSCRDYTTPGETLLRKDNGQPLCANYMTARFRNLFVRVLNRPDSGYRPTLHECRSLSERLYRQQGINTQVLLGHRSQAMTDKYNDDRGLDKNEYKFLAA
ncbi:MAG: tyrosine-type recombinase/integrase [Alistipes senegalensis]|nr:tyrosine-type recombinase/integrase [Oxalobacter formigenes]MCM1280952.1 tyrosine-type recombinase/integrase [Alistipes senegalensis]